VWSFIDEHANWAKRYGNLASLGLPDAVREEIRDIPNDYGGESRRDDTRGVRSGDSHDSGPQQDA
jgi:hypothetical protein